MTFTRKGLPLSPEEETELEDLLKRHEESQKFHDKMVVESKRLGIDPDNIESATLDQMMELSESMFGKK